VLQNISTRRFPSSRSPERGGRLGVGQRLHLAFDYRADLSDTSSVKSKLAVGAES